MQFLNLASTTAIMVMMLDYEPLPGTRGPAILILKPKYSVTSGLGRTSGSVGGNRAILSLLYQIHYSGTVL